LEFATLCAVRTGDIIGQRGRGEHRPPMRWEHVDLDIKLWTIPATENDSEHKVPLSDAPMAVLDQVNGLDPEIVCPSPTYAGQPLSNCAMLATLDRMGHGDITTHGMRSTFRDWIAEATTFQRELGEKALAHTILTRQASIPQIRSPYFWA
jgi:integrase